MSEMPKVKVAITGTIGSGKSSGAAYLRSLGYKVFISDEYNAYLLKKGNEGYNNIVKYFDVLDKSLEIDKNKLASIVFNDDEKLKMLESFTTKRIVEKIKELLTEDEVLFYEIPLLYELKLDRLFDKVITITANDKIRLERLVKRGITEADAKARIKKQVNDEYKVNHADYVIINDGDFKDLNNQIDKILKELL